MAKKSADSTMAVNHMTAHAVIMAVMTMRATTDCINVKRKNTEYVTA